MALNAKMFKQMGIAETTLSELMGDRTKITTDDVVKDYPNGITLLEFDVIPTNEGSYPLFVFKEDNTKFLNGGMILSKVVDRWLKEYDGDITACSRDLKLCGGVKVKLTKSETNSGNSITLVEFV